MSPILKNLLWRLTDIKDMLLHGPYQLDEWSTPILNLQAAIDLIEKELTK